MSIEDQVYEAARDAARDEIDQQSLVTQDDLDRLQGEIDRLSHDVQEALEIEDRIDDHDREARAQAIDRERRIAALEAQVLKPRTDGYVDTHTYSDHMTDQQRRTIFGLLKDLGWSGSDDTDYTRLTRIRAVNAVLTTPIVSFTHLSEDDAAFVIDSFEMALRVKEALV